MPRVNKTQSGTPALAVASTPGVRYGEGQQYAQLQSNLPAPNNRAASAPPSASGGSPPPSLPPEAAAANYVRPTFPLPEPGLLLAPTSRPNEPVTTGINLGPGEGPSALSMDVMQSPTGKMLRDLSRVTGRQMFADLARRSGL